MPSVGRTRGSEMWGHKQGLERGLGSSWQTWEGTWAASGNKDQPPPYPPNPPGEGDGSPATTRNRLFVGILNKLEYRFFPRAPGRGTARSPIGL